VVVYAQLPMARRGGQSPCHHGVTVSNLSEDWLPLLTASSIRIALVALLAALCPAHPVAAQAAEPFADRLSGDWGGLRSDLLERGIDLRLLLISDPYGNSRGGLETGFTGYSMLSGDLLLDTKPSLGIAGGEIHLGFSVNFGTQLSQDVVGNTFPIQSSDVAPPGGRLTTVSYTQSLLQDRLSLRLGRVSIDSLYGEEFAGSTYFRQFTSVAFNAIPFAIFYNAPAALGYPATTWGARARYQPNPGFYAMAGIYNGDPEVGLASRHGLDFTLAGPAFAIGEIGWSRPMQDQPSGLPGNLKIGAFSLAGAVPAYGRSVNAGGRHGFYLVADQAIARYGEPTEGRQLGVFGSLVTAPNASVSPMPVFFSTGLVANGPLAARPRDVLSFGLAYGGFSTALAAEQRQGALLDPSIRPQRSELTLELSYGLSLMPGVMIQPGAQLIVHPGGDPATPSALALGVNAVLSF
jgi:porin